MPDHKNLDSAIKLAHFKFSLIAPVIQENFTDPSKLAYYRRVAEKPLARPDGTSYLYNPRTLAAWELLYRKGGMDALMPGVRKDSGVTRNLGDDAIAEIYRIKEKYPRLNATQIHLALLRDGYITTRTSLRCVQRFIKSYDLKTGNAIALKDRKAFEEEFFGGMFQADSCYFPYIIESGKSRRTYLMLIIDDHSRFIVGSRLFYNDNAENFQILLKDAVATYGIPKKLYVDHGGPYANNQLALITGELGTVLLHPPVRDGAAKAKVERVFRTIKEQFLYGLDVKTVSSLDVFNQLLTEFIRKYNLSLHSGIAAAPMERFMKTRDKIKNPKSDPWLTACFMNRMNRKVRNDATVKIQGVSYDAPMQFIRHTVEVRFLPGRMESAYILHDQVRYPLRMTDKVLNGKTRREKFPTIDYSKGGTDHV